MAFEPIPGQYYRIVAKHSGKAVGAKDRLAHQGTIMTQVKPAAGDATQEFLISRHVDHYNFVTRQNNNTQSIDVFSDSLADNAAVGQWHRGDQQWNQQFVLLPAGDGTYYLSARHSQKFLCVKDGDRSDGAAVVQHIWNGGDHFRFSFEAVDPVHPRAQRELALRGADPLREAALGLIGLIPEVGGGVKFIVGQLWSDGPSLLDQMRDYVTGIAQALIDQEFINSLKTQLDGLRNEVEEYASATQGADRGQWMTNVIGALENAMPKFFDNRLPERTLTYLLTFGTLHLLMLRERHDKYEEIYGKKPKDPKDLLERLQKRVKTYVGRAASARQKTLDWRMGNIYSWSEKVRHTAGSSYEAFYARDDYDGWRFTADRTDQNVDQRRALRDAALAEHTRIAREQFTADLDGLFNAASAWTYLDPAATGKPKRTPVVVSSALFGNATGTKFDTGLVGSSLDSQIGEVTVWMNDARDQVVGLRIVRRDGKETKAGQQAGAETNKGWKSDEQVIAAYGNTHNGSLSSLYLVSNRDHKDHIMGSGQRAHGVPMASEPPLAIGSLDSIFGWATAGRIEGIGFRWTYPRHE